MINMTPKDTFSFYQIINKFKPEKIVNLIKSEIENQKTRKIVENEINSIPLLRLLQITFIIDEFNLKDNNFSKNILVTIYYNIE